jgi:superfamily II DNA helicase RecQ
MSMTFFWIPARHGQAAQDDLNRALRTLRVVGVDKHFCPSPSDPGWAVCIEHVETAAGSSAAGAVGGKAIDYREVLDPATFKVFAALRNLRKEIAAAEVVPIYAVMTNEQLAAIARQRCKTLEQLKAVEGVGEARARKYGPRFLEVLRQSEVHGDGVAGDQGEGPGGRTVTGA